MPSEEQWKELRENTKSCWTTRNGVNGRLFTSNNGNSLFLPAAGYRFLSSLRGAGSYGYYWSSSLFKDGLDGVWNFCYRQKTGREKKNRGFLCGFVLVQQAGDDGTAGTKHDALFF